MLNPDCVYMLAGDHRWQWEEWFDARAISRERISDVKRVIYNGFLMARDRSPAVRQAGALLLDTEYASRVIPDALAAGIEIGTPAERAGAFPLAWTAEPFWRALVGRFVKVLVRHRPDDDEGVREGQLQKLDRLQAWCGDAGKPLVLEVLVARRNEDPDQFESSGRPAMLAAYIEEAYRRGLVPAFWKIEGTPSADGARIVDRAIAAHPSGRQIILGKGADAATIDQWFAAAADSRTAVGFAIGRSVVWDPATAFLTGNASASEAASDICATYLRLVDTWQRRHSSTATT
jgi:myo-inositol catabolism protein IolC